MSSVYAANKTNAPNPAGLGALVLFAAYTEDIKHFSKEVGSKLEGIVVTFDLSNPYVVVGLLIGGMLPYLFGSMGMQACIPIDPNKYGNIPPINNPTTT